MKKKLKIFSVVMATSLAVVMTGCGSDNKAPAKQASGGGAKILNVGVNFFSPTLDPHKDYDGWYVVRYGIGENLVHMSDNMEAKPCLATSWEVVDKNTWKITIRKDVKFHNGRAMTPEAVKESILRSASVNKRGASNLCISSIDVKGQDLIIHTKEPRPDLIYELSDPYCVIVDTKAAAENPAAFDKGAICTGPFKVKDFVDKISVTVTAFDGYWNKRAKIDEAKFVYLNDPDTRMMALQSGDIDASINIDSKNIKLFEDKNKYTISRKPSLRSTYALFNTKNQFLSDKNLRTALIMAADKKNYIKSVMGGAGVEGVGFYPTLLPYNSQSLKYPSYDLAGAKKLLADSGYKDSNGDGILEKDGKPVELVISSYTSRAEIPGLATAMQADFNKLGIKTTIKTYDTLPRAQFTAGDYDIGFTSFTPSTNGRPVLGLKTAFVKGAIENYCNYFYNDRVEKIVKELEIESDFEKQNKLAFEAQQCILDEKTNIFLAYTENLYISKSRVKNFNAHALDYYVLDNQVDIEAK